MPLVRGRCAVRGPHLRGSAVAARGVRRADLGLLRKPPAPSRVPSPHRHTGTPRGNTLLRRRRVSRHGS